MGTKFINWSAIQRHLKVPKWKVYNFRMGATKALEKDQIRKVKALLNSEYRENMAFLNQALKGK